MVALAVFRMPAVMVAGAVADGLVFGWFRIAWIVVAAVFVYDISVESGQFEIIKQSIGDISDDRRLQVLLIAFAFGALLEGAGGGGAPVAVTGAMMIGLGFPPFQTALMCLIANSAPVAYGGLGNPVRTLVAVTGLPEADFSAMIGRILPLTTLVLPFWLIRVLVQDARHAGRLARTAGLRNHLRRHPVLLVELHRRVAGGHPGRHRHAAGAGAVFFRYVWQPREIWRYSGEASRPRRPCAEQLTVGPHRAGMVAVPAAGGLRGAVGRAVGDQGPGHGLLAAAGSGAASAGDAHASGGRPSHTPNRRMFDVSWLSTPGTGTFIAGLIAGPLIGLSFQADGAGLLRVAVRA